MVVNRFYTPRNENERRFRQKIHRRNEEMRGIVGSWYYQSGCLYVVVNSGGTVEKRGRVSWLKRLKWEIMECIGKPVSIHHLHGEIK